MKTMSIYPNNVTIKYDYIKVDNIYIASIIICELPKRIAMFILNKIIPNNTENIATIYVAKGDLINKVKELTKIITETNSEIKNSSVNQQDIDVLRKINDDATELRRKLQVDNEDIYNVSIYISLSDLSLDNLKLKINKIISNLYAISTIAKVANFRQDQVYLNVLPINKCSNTLNKQTEISITSSQLAYLIPYISNNMYDNNGIVYGFMNSAICIYDIFSKNNMNHNMAILGSSGAGKSYFLKLLILRNYCMNIMQVIFDIEGEYVSLAKNVDGIVFNDENFNFLYIPENYVLNNESDFFDKKVRSVFYYLSHITQGEILAYEKICIKKIKEIYNAFGIDKQKDSMYENYMNESRLSLNKEYKSYDKFPTLIDLELLLEKEERIPKSVTKKIKSENIFKKYSKDKETILDDKSKKIIVFDLENLDIKNINIYIEFFKQYYGDKLLVYIDEMWKFVKRYSDYKMEQTISELFKTIRKNNAGIVIISQDIHDILGIGDGYFGKSVLNNSFTRVFFKMQYIDLSSLSKIGLCSDEVVTSVRNLTIGSAVMSVGDNTFNIDIKASEFENSVIKGGDLNKENINCYG